MYELVSGGASIGASTDLTAHTVTVTTGTITTSSPAFNSTQTWNAGGVPFTGLKLNVTDTASAAASLLIDLQVNGSSRIKVDKYGVTTLGSSSTPSGSVLTLTSQYGSSTIEVFGGGATYFCSQTISISNGGGVGGALVLTGGTGTSTVAIQGGVLRGVSTSAIIQVSGNTTGTLGGSLAFPPGASNTTITTNVTNCALDSSGFQRLTGASTPVLAGIAPPSGGAHVAGRTIHLFNVGATSIVLSHNDSTTTATSGGAVATAANRMFMSTGANITLAQNQSVRLTYDSTDNGSGAAGWRCTSAS